MKNASLSKHFALIAQSLVVTIILFQTALAENKAEGKEDILELFSAQTVALPDPAPLLNNAPARDKVSLNGTWNIVVDEHEMGERPFLGGPYYKRPDRSTGMELIEFMFDDQRTLEVPGDWNSQDLELFRYRGVVWYERSFDLKKKADERYLLHFDGVNYNARVYVNGQPVGEHTGGYVAFNFEITDQVTDGANYVSVRVNSYLDASTVPTHKTSDFFKYGGITRDVSLITTPKTYVRQYQASLADLETGTIKGFVQLDGADAGTSITIDLPELGKSKTIESDQDGYAEFEIQADLDLWSPESPKLYEMIVQSGDSKVVDQVGFRTIERVGDEIHLNGKPIYLRGISMHDESYLKSGVAFDEGDARAQLGLIKELNGNFVRLSHYPHNEYAVRIADEIGLMVWSEIPIVSNIDWINTDTLEVAKLQLRDNINRDRNRASIVMWSIGNETMPQTEERLKFLGALADVVREEDKSDRLIAAALVGDARKEFGEVTKRLVAQMVDDDSISEEARAHFEGMITKMKIDKETVLEEEIEVMLTDKLGEIVDVIGYNEYFGWYYSSFLKNLFPVNEEKVREHMFQIMQDIRFRNAFGKPLLISEFGAGAKHGLRSKEALLWSEEYQAKVYKYQTDMLSRSEMIQGMSPWILKDFRSAMRNLNGVQDIYNRKGLVSEKGERKLAFDVLRDFYAEQAKSQEAGTE